MLVVLSSILSDIVKCPPIAGPSPAVTQSFNGYQNDMNHNSRTMSSMRNAIGKWYQHVWESTLTLDKLLFSSCHIGLYVITWYQIISYNSRIISSGKFEKCCDISVNLSIKWVLVYPWCVVIGVDIDY